MTNEFDDPELERMLGRLSGAYPDANVAYEVVRGRVRQVKRRRAFVASTAACALLLGVAVVAAQTGGSTDELSPAEERSETTVEVTDSSAPVTTDVAGATEDTSPTTDSEAPDTSTPDTMAPASTVAADHSGHGSTSSGQGNTGQGGTVSPNSGPGSTSGDPTTSAHGGSGGPTTSVTLPPGERAWTTEGGSVTVRNLDGALTLISVDPAPGFHAADGREVQNDRIRIEFTNGQTTWRVEIRTDNGKSVAEISHHG